jgi:hypothetical protein
VTPDPKGNPIGQTDLRMRRTAAKRMAFIQTLSDLKTSPLSRQYESVFSSVNIHIY